MTASNPLQFPMDPKNPKFISELSIGRRARQIAFLAFCFVATQAAHATAIQFRVIDPATGKACPTAVIQISSDTSLNPPIVISGKEAFDPSQFAATSVHGAEQITLYAEQPTTLKVQQDGKGPVKDIYINVTAHLVRKTDTTGSQATTRDQSQIKKFAPPGENSLRNVIATAPGVASDSGGQQHIRGEHTSISYVVDGIPIPDTLSGRQSSLISTATIKQISVIVGGFAPEFGGQTAGILDIQTIGAGAKRSTELELTDGDYGNNSGTITAVGTINPKLSYVFNASRQNTGIESEASQPDNQTAHNAGNLNNAFGQLSWSISKADSLKVFMSTAPDQLEIGNRTGLGSQFAAYGEGYGFLGMRNADGTRPDANSGNASLLGAQPIVLPSQQAAGMDIFTTEHTEFGSLKYQHTTAKSGTLDFGVVVLHSGQDVSNNNPAVNVLNLPVDNSIEFNPEANRNIHHLELIGSLTKTFGNHTIKIGSSLDSFTGNEFYEITPASQLALDGLAATAPNLAPAGSATADKDINGNPVYKATSSTPGSLAVARTGYYDAAYLQDTWKLAKPLTINFGFRGDWYNQKENLGQAPINAVSFSPRLNISYNLTKRDTLGTSYNKLFNTPALAQGAILGQPLKPEIVYQYDVSLEHRFSRTQSVKLAYYYKDIENQVDVSLLLPGSMVGLYTGVNFQQGGVHGLEFSYDFTGSNNVGWDGFFNYTYSIAKPNGLDNTGAEVPQYNDHDQSNTLSLALSYTWKSGLAISGVLNHGSGFASSVLAEGLHRNPHTQLDLSIASGDRLFGGHGGLSLGIQNVFDTRQILNFQSGFDGTKFQTGRVITLAANFKFN